MELDTHLPFCIVGRNSIGEEPSFQWDWEAATFPWSDWTNLQLPWCRGMTDLLHPNRCFHFHGTLSWHQNIFICIDPNSLKQALLFSSLPPNTHNINLTNYVQKHLVLYFQDPTYSSTFLRLQTIWALLEWNTFVVYLNDCILETQIH